MLFHASIFQPDERMVKIVKATNSTALFHHNIADDPEVMKAFQDALQDPELRKEIISILEEAGLLPESNRQPA